MSDAEARRIIRQHYDMLARTRDERELRQTVQYLGQLLSEHMTSDAAPLLAEWILGQEQMP